MRGDNLGGLEVKVEVGGEVRLELKTRVCIGGSKYECHGERGGPRE